MAYGDFKDLKYIAFAIASNPKYDGFQRGLVSMIYKFFDNKPKRSDNKNEIKENQQVANELHKPIIRKFKKENCILLLKTIFGALIY